MKKKMLVMVMIMISILFVSCQSKSSEGLRDSVNPIPTSSENKLEEENKVEVNLMTKEEFLTYVEENQDLELVNIEAEDLVGIDIDDFIKYYQFTKDNVGWISLQYALEGYLEDLPVRELEPYMAKEIISVTSSEEEYESFKEEYFKKIDTANEFLFFDEYGMDNYDIIAEDKSYRVIIGQTQNLEKCWIDKDNEGLYEVIYEGDPSLALPIAYSKNSKYFILSRLLDEKDCELVKIFCELED